MAKDTERIVTDNDDSIFLTREEDEVFWLAIITSRGRALQIKLTVEECDALAEVLNER